MKRGIINEEQATVALLPYVISASLGTRVCYRRALAKNVAQKRLAVAAHRCACARVTFTLKGASVMHRGGVRRWGTLVVVADRV